MSEPRRPIRFADFLDQRRVSQPRCSPDGRWVVFVGRRPDMDGNRNESHLFRVPLAGGDVEQLTRGGTANTDPAFSPDGETIAFTSNRGEGPQIWLLPAAGGEARQLTSLRLGARRPVWFPDQSRLLAISTVHADTGDPQEIGRREDERERRGTTPRVIDDLMFRHWDSWGEGRIDHLFEIDAVTGAGRDLTPGPYPVPPRSLSGDPDYAIAPDGSEITFVALRDQDQARSTNTNLWRIPARGVTADAASLGEPERVSPRAGANMFPTYSPDGSRIAYCGMRRAGYESDRLDLLIFDRNSGETRDVAPDFDRSVGPPAWSPDGRRLFFSAQENGRTRLWSVGADGGKPEPLTDGASDHTPVLSPDGEWLVFDRETLASPPELFRVARDGGPATALTTLNEASLAKLELGEVEELWYEGAAGARVHGIMVKPPGFDPSQRYPVVFLIHGGPQGMFGLDFHERWNGQMFAAPGYVVVMLNPRGSTGYGQGFTDAIRGHWGGDCYEDLTRGFDHVFATYPFCDSERTAAAGASFGGFMVNWIAGHSDRFSCLVSHDGIFNTEMMDYLTDELWFTEWEFEGAPWESPEAYSRYSPHRHVENMKTPTLVIQGELDFRCPVSEGLGMFTALKRRGVPARLLYLADEGHWVLKPRNREVWWNTVLGWLETYLKPA